MATKSKPTKTSVTITYTDEQIQNAARMTAKLSGLPVDVQNRVEDMITGALLILSVERNMTDVQIQAQLAAN